MEKTTSWLEFKWKDLPGVKFIPNSISLGFSENYSDLGGLDGLLEVGYKTLEGAIISLAEEEKISEGTKNPLRVISVMVSEATRFKKLSDVFVPAVQKKKDVEFMKPWMRELIESWVTLSNLLLQKDAKGGGFCLPGNKDGSPNKLTTIEELKICTAADAATQCVAVLYRGDPDKPLAILPTLDLSNSSIVGKGLPLVEVYSVRINNVSGEIYGRIELDDGLGIIPIYNQQRDKPESIQENGIVTLTGPYRGISMSQCFDVSLDLKKGASVNSSTDVEVSKGKFGLDIYELFNVDGYGELVSSVVNGKFGSAIVYYTPFRDVMQVNVEVMLVNGAGKDPANIYGNIVGRYSNYNYPPVEKKYYQSVFFDKLGKDNVRVKPGKTIPLSRNVIAVPTNGSLILEGNLWNYNSPTSSDEIANGSAEFSPQWNRNDDKFIEGKFGRVLVTVTWNDDINC